MRRRALLDRWDAGDGEGDVAVALTKAQVSTRASWHDPQDDFGDLSSGAVSYGDMDVGDRTPHTLPSVINVAIVLCSDVAPVRPN